MKDIRKYLLDIVLTVDDLLSFSSKFTLLDLENNVEHKWAVERGVSIIGEVAYQLWKLNNELPISNWKPIMGTRHIIVHDYDRVDNEKLIVILKKHLPLLRKEVQDILNSYDKNIE